MVLTDRNVQQKWIARARNVLLLCICIKSFLILPAINEDEVSLALEGNVPRRYRCLVRRTDLERVKRGDRLGSSKHSILMTIDVNMSGIVTDHNATSPHFSTNKQLIRTIRMQNDVLPMLDIDLIYEAK